MFSSSTTFSSATHLKRSRHDGTRRDSNTPARYSQSVQARFELETASLLLSNGPSNSAGCNEQSSAPWRIVDQPEYQARINLHRRLSSLPQTGLAPIWPPPAF